MLDLLRVELLKVRRSLALAMMVVIPLFVVLLTTAMLLKRHQLGAMSGRVWTGYMTANLAIWCSFMLPLYIALVTGLLNGHEHKNQTWRLMLTLPVSQPALYATKLLLAWLFVAGANLVLAAALTLVVSVLGLAGADTGVAFDYPLWKGLAGVTAIILPVLAIQHAVSWRYANLVAPLATGIVGSMGIMQIGSSQYWAYYPWSWPMMYVMGSNPDHRAQALQLGAGVGAALCGATILYLGKRAIRT
ncbi:MAG TPA: ABC transporter permease [Burkholderiaceae bacterium]